MKLKKGLLTTLSFVLVAAVAIGGTVAYLTSTDSDANVMTLGNVEIVQHELERVDINEHNKTNAVKFKNFTQAKPLYPAVLEMDGYAANDPAAWAPAGADGALEDHYVNYGDFVTADVAAGASAWNGVWGTSLKNVMDKFVFVENTGESDAYYRTIILLEYDETQTKNSNNQPMIHFNYNGNALFAWEGINDLTTVEVNGEVYKVLVATYKNPLKPGTVSRPSLLQVGLDGEATNEIVAQFGDTYDVLVLSQAVQTEGFANAQTALNTAFGEINALNVAEWFDGMIIPVYAEGAEQVEKALENGGELFLQEDISADKHTVNEGVKVDIDLQDNTLSGIVNNKGEMNVSGGKMEADYMNNYGDATFSDVEMKAGTSTDYANIGRANSVTEYNNVNIEAEGGAIGLVDGAEAVFNSGSVKIIGSTTNPRYNFYVVGDGTKLTINDGTFSFTSTTLKRSYIYAGAGATVTINGGTFGSASTRQAAILGDGKVIIKGGTFGFDPSAWVAEGYEAVKNGSTWTVSAK